MFFLASKLFWLIAEPSNLLALAFCVGAVALATRHARKGRALLAAAGLVYVVCAMGPVSIWLTRPLEDRFARPGPEMAAPDGVIVLGGAMDETMVETRHALVLGEFGSRMTEAVALAHRFPQARMVFTGGSADIIGHGASEALAARQFFEAMGVPPGRFVYEDRSRNTVENAVFTKELVEPKPGERWLLVTSGFHMPRAMGVFRRAGFDVVAWPADYRTSGGPDELWQPILQASSGLRQLDIVMREWIGLVAYRLSGKSDALLPGP